MEQQVKRSSARGKHRPHFRHLTNLLLSLEHYQYPYMSINLSNLSAYQPHLNLLLSLVVLDKTLPVVPLEIKLFSGLTSEAFKVRLFFEAF